MWTVRCLLLMVAPPAASHAIHETYAFHLDPDET